MAFVAGLAVGVLVCRLTMGRARPAEPLVPAAVTEPEPAAPKAAAEPAAAEVAEAEVAAAKPDDRAAAVDDVVAELERRVRGRRTDEADGATGGRRGKRD